MASKDYSDEFTADAVALYRSTPGAPCQGIAADPGSSRGTSRTRVLPDRERRGSAAPARPSGGKAPAEASAPGPGAAADERSHRLQARVRELEASERKPATERDLLRKAAKHFAGRTHW